VVPHTHEIQIEGAVVRKSYVAWDDDEPAREWAGLEHLGRHAPDLAPTPIARESRNGQPVVVMARVPGKPLADKLSDRQVVAFIEALQRLFDVPVPPELAVRANGPSLQSRFRPWLAEEYEWDLCADRGLVRTAVGSAQEWLDANPPDAEWIVDPVIALGDGNLDNVMWDGERCRLIDWEEFGVSDLAYEIADVVEHASSRLRRLIDVPTLLADLRLSRAQRERVERHRRMFACFWLAMMLPGNAGWRRNPSGSVEDQARHLLDLLSVETRVIGHQRGLGDGCTLCRAHGD
jgi:aminoglycoside phosphotransferase (APT) family kinase protein